jgi:hypothetical protein
VESGVNSLGVTTTGSVPAVTQSPFADLYKEGSVYFNGTVGNYLQNTATYSNNSINWSTAGLTVEAWVNYPTFTGASLQGTAPAGMQIPTLFCYGSPTSFVANPSFGANVSGYVTFYYYNGTFQTVTTQTQISANTWNHIAVTCSTSGQIFLFINGVQSQVVANRNGTLQSAAYFESVQGTITTPVSPLVIGQLNSVAVNAYVADLRLTTGTPVYTGSTSSYATFTVPSAPLSLAASGTTQFLLRAGQNSPTIQSGALTFDRGLKQFMNFGAQNFNIATRGFTAVFRYTWNGTVSNFERIFQASLSKADQNNSIIIVRNGTSAQLYFQYVVGGAYAPTTVTSTLSQGTTYTVAFVYNPSVGSGTAQFWVNGAPSGSATTGLATTITTDLLCPFTFIGCEFSGAAYFTNASMNTFAVYNRALSNVEILNAYSALTTATTNAPIEIGDSNGTPALSIAGDGRVSVTQLGQTSNVVPWPPSAMTGYDTVINGGVYKARASNEFNSSYPAWYAFDKSSSTGWAGQSGQYSASGVAPYLYAGSNPPKTLDVNGTSFNGEWLQVQMPSVVTLSSYSIYYNTLSGCPSLFWVLGSRDGVNWVLVDSRVQLQPGSSGYITFTLASAPSQSFGYYRLAVGGLTTTGGTVNVFEWTLYGTADTAQTLTVAQPVTLSYGAQTASLTGIAGDRYVPQDFSSSGLNVPAYVVSNTATVANTVAYSSFGPFAGEGSVYFPGAAASSGAYINFPAGTPAASMTPATAFTAETFLYLAGTPTPTYCGVFDSVSGLGGSDNWGINLNGTNATFFIWPTSGSPAQITGSATLINTWFHIAASYDGTTLRLFINGALANSTSMVGTPRLIAGSILVVGTNGIFRTGCPMYMADARIVTGTALYTSAFTPPTAPLQPIQGVTQAGLPYGTVLLLRNAPAPGRVLTSKFGGANSGGVNGAPLTLAFPPAAMTGYATSLNAGYGQGTYVASASSEASTRLIYLAFDKSVTSGFWQIATAAYTANTPYSGSVATVDVTGTSYSGEWIQIQMPSSIVLSTYSVTTDTTNSPSKWFVFGSRDGTNWSLVDQRSGQTSWTNQVAQTFATSSSQSYNFYRFVVNTSIGVQPMLYELVFNGTIEGPNVTADGRLGVGVSNPVQALEVAGSAVVAGTLSAGNPLMFRNALYNGDMRINQRGMATNMTFLTVVGATSNFYGLDRWNVLRGGSQTGACVGQGTLATTDAPYSQGLQYFLRFGRVNGDTGTNGMFINYNIETRDSYRFAGQPVTLSFWYRTGSGFSGSSVGSSIFSGTGTDQTLRGGYTGQTTLVTQSFNTTNAWQLATMTTFVPLTATQVGFQINYTPSGTAGGFDYFDVTGVQLEKGSVATPYEIRPYATELALCQRYYQEIPNINGEHFSGTGRNISTNNGTNGTLICTIPLPVPMRASPTPTYYGGGTTGGVITCVTGSGGTQVERDIAASNVSSQSMCGIIHGFNITNGGALPVSGGASQWIDMGWANNKRLGITFSSEL